MEFIDVTDRYGRHTGVKKPRSLVHRDGDYHRTVHIWIRSSGGGLLFQLRSPQKETHPNLWDISAAGHISAGDTAEETAIRETHEELGIQLQSTDLEFLGAVNQEYRSPDGSIIDREVAQVYLSRLTFEITDFSPSLDEVTDLKFISPESLRTKIAQPDRSLVPHAKEYRMVLERVW